jgi:hypothetical protein
MSGQYGHVGNPAGNRLAIDPAGDVGDYLTFAFEYENSLGIGVRIGVNCEGFFLFPIQVTQLAKQVFDVLIHRGAIETGNGYLPEGREIPWFV